MNIFLNIRKLLGVIAFLPAVIIFGPVSLSAAEPAPRYGVTFGQQGNEVEMQVVPARLGLATNTMPKPGDSAITAIIGTPVTNSTAAVPPRAAGTPVQLDSQAATDYKEDGFDTVIEDPPTTPDTTSPMSDELDASGRVSVDGIRFSFDRSAIMDSSLPALNKVLAMLQTRPTLAICIEGYTDASGRNAYNLELSKARAKAVKKWLVDNGIDPSRLTAKGQGERGSTSDSAAQMAKNRRVDIVKVSE